MRLSKPIKMVVLVASVLAFVWVLGEIATFADAHRAPDDTGLFSWWYLALGIPATLLFSIVCYWLVRAPRAPTSRTPNEGRNPSP